MKTLSFLIKKMLSILIGLILCLSTLIGLYVIWNEAEGLISCGENYHEPYRETGVTALCYKIIKKGAEKGEQRYLANYADILIGDHKYKEAAPFVRQCVLEQKSCTSFALELCQKSIPGFDVDFIEQAFAIADRSTHDHAETVRIDEKSYRMGALAPCIPKNR